MMEFTKDIKFNINPTIDKLLTITYNGFLSGSESVSIVYGFGENWENTTETIMSKKDNSFEASIKMLNFDTFNFCFKNNNNEWDNNSYCNYITHIEPAIVQTIDIDALIEEILQPVVLLEKQEILPVQVFSSPIDLGEEISNVLSQINDMNTYKNESEIPEYSTLDEILTCEVISSQIIDEEKPVSDLNVELQENINETINKLEIEQPIQSIENTELEKENNIETSLIPTTDNFMISPRKLSKFYTFKKRLKLAFYKAFVKIPQLLIGFEKDNN